MILSYTMSTFIFSSITVNIYFSETDTTFERDILFFSWTISTAKCLSDKLVTEKKQKF